MLLHASWWTAHEGAIGIFVGLAAIIVALLIAVAQRRPKTLAWDVVFDEALINPRREVPKLKLTWDGEKVEQPRLLVVRLENTGRQAILQNDYLNLPTIKANNGRLLSVEINSHSGRVYDKLPDFGQLEGKSDWIFHAPALNPREWVEIQFVIDGGDSANITARIASETKEFRRQTLPVAVSRWTRFVSIWGIVGIAVAVITGWAAHNKNSVAYYIGAVVVLYFAIGMTLMPRISRRMRQLNMWNPERAAEQMSINGAPGKKTNRTSETDPEKADQN